MPTIASFLPSSLLLPPPISSSSSLFLSRGKLSSPFSLRFGLSKPRLAVLVAASAASFDELDATGKSKARSSKKSIISNFVQEIDPLDLNIIQKDVPADTVDAMKRTISGMLGLLPSDQFHVLVEAFWNPLFKLLVSSMTTGYTLRNAEYRLCLERNLDICEDHSEKQKIHNVKHDSQEIDRSSTMFRFSERDGLLPDSGKSEEASVFDNIDIEYLGEITPEAQKYILYLKSRMSSAQKELDDLRRENSALQMQKFVGEEKNDLLDYLRSLEPEKICNFPASLLNITLNRRKSAQHIENTNCELLARGYCYWDKIVEGFCFEEIKTAATVRPARSDVAELSEPTCPDVQETIHSVAHGLLANLSPKMHSKAPPQSENAPTSTINVENDDCTELVENTSLQFQPIISLSRDYLARLLFWCMLLGHYIRGLEYRLELMQLLTISGDTETASLGGDSVA